MTRNEITKYEGQNVRVVITAPVKKSGRYVTETSTHEGTLKWWEPGFVQVGQVNTSAACVSSIEAI